MSTSPAPAGLSPDWALPLDILLQVASLFIPEEPYINGTHTFHRPEFIEDHRALRKLTYLCRSTRELLEPRLFRFIALESTADITHYWVLLAQNPHIRPYVRHIVCYTPMEWGALDVLLFNPKSYELAQKIWKSRCPNQHPSQVLRETGFYHCPLIDRKRPHHLSPEWIASMFGSILIMAAETETLCYSIWHWEDALRRMEDNTTYLMGKAISEGMPLMPNLRALQLCCQFSCSLSPVFKTFFSPPLLWKNLKVLVFDNAQFFKHFFDAVVTEPFDLNLPVEELYIHSQELVDMDETDMPQNIKYAEYVPEPSLPDLEKRFRAYRATIPDVPLFPNLRLLDVIFSPSEQRDREGCKSLLVFLDNIGGAPETFRLRKHPFPSAALGTQVQRRLKTLVVQACSGMAKQPSVEEILEAKRAVVHDGMDCLTSLESIEINGIKVKCG